MKSTKSQSMKTDMFATESMWKLMAKMCIPAVLTILIMVIYNIADIYFIGQLGDSMKVAGISLVMPLMTINSALGSMMGTGCCSCISVALGRHDTDKVKKFSSFSLYFSLIIGVVFAAIIYIGMNPILTILGTSNATRGFAEEYLRIIAAFFPVMIANTTLGQVIRAEGAAKEGMLGNMIGTIANIILDPIFILVLNMGVSGAAIATVIGNLLSLAYYFWYFTKKSYSLSISIKDFTFATEISIACLAIGLPSGISTVLSSIANIFENNLLVGYGDNYVAAMSVAGKATMVIFMLQMGVAMGMQPIIAYSYGARNWSRMKESIAKTAIFNIVLGTGLTILCRVFGQNLVTAFIDDSSVIGIGITVIGISTLTGPFVGLYQLCTGFLQATEKPSYATLISLLRQGLLFIPAIYIMNRLFGFLGIIWCQPVVTFLSIMIAILLSVVRYRQIIRNNNVTSATSTTHVLTD